MVCRAFLVSLCVSLAATLMFAQNDLATLRGVITDQSGATVAGALVNATNTATAAAREVTSNEQGEYEIPYLVQGTYRLTVTAGGFQTFVAQDVLIRARELRRLDAQLAIGSASSKVDVSVGAAVISTEGSQVSAGFNNTQFVNSALSQQTFFPQSYMTTLPSVQTQNGNVNLRFAGQGPGQIAEAMDGIINDGANNLVQNMNDFEDLQVIPVNNSAEYSRVGQFTMVSRGGGNQFHGRAEYDLANSYFNARSFFTPTKTPFKEHRGLANVSGPIIKDKLFFYAAYNFDRVPASSYYTRNVPTDRMRGGDFSDYLRQSPAVVIKDPLTNVAFPGNMIPGSRINSVSQKIQDMFIPRANRQSGTSILNNYGFTQPYPTDLLKWDGVTTRIDYRASDKNQMFGRFINRITPYVLAGSFEQLGEWTRVRNSSSLVFNDTYTFSPTLVNSFQWGWSRDYIIDGDTVDGVTPTRADVAIAAIGLQGVNPQGLKVMGFPTIQLAGLQTLSQSVGGVNGNRNDQQFSNTTSWAVSRHVFKFGGILRYFHDHPQGITADTFGNFNFTGSLSGNSYSDFLLGLPVSATRANPITNRVSTAYELGFFFGDTYKVTQNLTLDLGLRWEYFPSARYQDGLQYRWDSTTGNVVVDSSALARVSALYPSSIKVVAGDPYPSAERTNFRPRLGLAYRLGDRMVLRGGYGQYTEALGNLYRLQGGGPFQVSETYFNTISGGQALLSFPNPFPGSTNLATVPSQSVVGYPTQTDQGIIHQFNATLERDLGHGFGARVSYIGSRSHGLNYQLELNKPRASTTAFTAARRPFPQFVSTQYWQNDGNAKYNAGQIEIQKRSGGLTLDAHYTLSSSMSDFGDLENPYNHHLWNRDAFNSRHRFVFNATYELPVGKGKKYLASAPRAVDAALGGWQLNWVTYLQSGQYFSPTFSGSDPSNTNTIGGAPDRIADGNLARDNRSPDHWFDPTAFAIPKAGTYGNSGVNILEGPGLRLNHLSLLKSFAITERVHMIFQANATNLFNTPHWDFPFANISVPSTAGHVYQLRDAASGGLGGKEYSGPRQIAFRLRLEF